jgi:hypothetical protein
MVLLRLTVAGNLEKKHFFPCRGPNGGSVAMDSAVHDHRLSSALQIQTKYLVWKTTSRHFVHVANYEYVYMFLFKQRKKIVIYVVLDVFFVQLGKEIGNKLGAGSFFYL